MGLRYGQGKYGEFKYGLTEAGFESAIKIYDSSGVLKAHVTSEIVSVDWSYNDRGGCDKASIVLKRDFDDLSNLTASSKDEIYDVRIYIVPEFGESSTLFWRGEIAQILPSLKDEETVTVKCLGYVHRLRKLQIHSSGAPVEYSSTTISAIVTSVFNTYVDPNTDISAGTIDTFSTSVSSMKFNGSVYDAMERLAEIVDAEWGVDRSLNFFFRERSTTRGAFRINQGQDVSQIDDEYDYDQIINKIIIEGGEVSGTPVRYVKTDSASVTKYGLRETRVVNSSIRTELVAEQMANAYLNKYSEFQRNFRAILPLANTLIEETTPLDLVVIDTNPRPDVPKYGSFKYGNDKYGAEEDYRIRNIHYTLNDTSLTIEIEFNEGKPDITKQIEELEFELEQLREASQE